MDWLARNVITILLLVILARWVARSRMGKRGLVELMMINAIGDLASHVVFDSEHQLGHGLFSIIFWTVFAGAAAWLAAHWESFRHWYFGDHHELVRDGVPDPDALKLQRMSQAELDAELRKHGVEGLSEAKTVTLESDGTVSVVKALSTAQELRKLATTLEQLAARVDDQSGGSA
jgi:uncharacterized membrane protein YcaP (DUF421 family)